MKIALNKVYHIGYLKNRFIWRNYEKISNIYNYLSSTDKVGIFGSYYSSNVGDLSMGFVIKEFSKKYKISPNLVSQSLSTNKSNFNHIICGGGELGDEKYFNTVFRLARKPENVSIIGISPWCNLHESSPYIIKSLKNVLYFSVRNKAVRDYLVNILNRKDIRYAPDLAFALPYLIKLKRNNINSKKKKIAGINIIPFYCNILSSGYFVPSSEAAIMFETVAPKLSSKISIMIKNYISLIVSIINQLQKKFDRIVALPFSYGDYVFSKQLFNNLNIIIHPFTSSFKYLLREIATYDLFIATRLHSHIFSVLTRTPIVSIAYASKCINLLQDIGLNGHSGIVTRDDILECKPEHLATRLIDSDTIVIDETRLENISEQSAASIENMLMRLK